MMQVGIALNAPTIDFISHPQRWTKGVAMSFLFAAQLGRLGTVGRIAARQFLIIRCLWNDFLFQNEIAEGGFASVLPQVRNKTRQFAQAQRGTVTNFDLFDAWPFLLARRRAAVCFSGWTDCCGLFLGSTTLRMPCGERHGLWTKAKHQPIKDQFVNGRQPNCVGFLTPRFVLSEC